MGTEGSIVTCACDHLSIFGATMVSYTHIVRETRECIYTPDQ